MREAAPVPADPPHDADAGTGAAGTRGEPDGIGPWAAALAAALGGPRAAERAEVHARRVHASYRERTSAAEAARDVLELARLARAYRLVAPGGPRPAAEAAGPGGALAGPAGTGTEPRAPAMGRPHRLLVRPATPGDGCSFRIRRYGPQAVELSALVPLLESFGVAVVEAVPHEVGEAGEGEPAAHIDDVGVRLTGEAAPGAQPFSPVDDGPRLLDALDAVARGASEVDSLNRLVTAAGLRWAQVTVLRAYLRYWRQWAGRDAAELADPLVAHPGVTRALVAYFEARFTPGPAGSPAVAGAGAADPEGARHRCLAALDGVQALHDDEVLRGFLHLIDGTTRTTAFQTARAAGPPTLALKFDSAAVPHLPAPRPLVEVFVHGPTLEGIHLRAGLVARGGIRWSERPDDLRTEVLDLAMAQVKKNAIIVPTGAKGGFVCRAPAGPAPADVRAAYEAFVAALLDLTDNLVGGEVVPPAEVVRLDGPDPYLVVAADKGTATFSDLANAISVSRGYWLGDAFASGGSHGYDHKAMRITARGAWVAVRRHFHQLGLDPQVDPVRVVGVGDMSGDVFGGGMLQSAAIRLLAAFDHRHVFLDPDPDPASSFAERRRLAALPRSSWDDYDRSVLSPGGGVWSRDTKVVPLSPQAREALGVEAEALSPPELISAILAAPVDLLWFGGIGTFIKAPDEPDSEVADHANDGVRITSDRVRARVVAEGANLAVTQRARIRYSRRGGRINADFVDNAAGVATSDREVNLKVLLALAIEEGRLHPAVRDELLARCQEEVAAEVLRQVDHNVMALNRAVLASQPDLDAYEALIEELSTADDLDRVAEKLPSAGELATRRAAGGGLSRPELAVLLAYAKSDLVSAVEESTLVADPSLLDAVLPYFPSPVREAFPDLVPRHRLYPQLVATDVAGEIVDQLGIVWAHETAAELDVDLPAVAAAFWAARQVVGAGERWAQLEGHVPSVPADAEAEAHRAISDAVARLARTYLVRGGVDRVGTVIDRDTRVADALGAGPPGKPTGAGQHPPPGGAGSLPARLSALGMEPTLAEAVAAAVRRAEAADVSTVLGSLRRTADGGTTPGAAQVAAVLDEVAAIAGWPKLLAALDEAVAAPLGRLRAWEARALADDLREWRCAAATQALRAGVGHPDPEAAVSAWAAGARRDLDQLRQLAAALDDPAADPLTVVAVALRRLRRTVAAAP